jgi:hypothetical protein
MRRCENISSAMTQLADGVLKRNPTIRISYVPCHHAHIP